MQSFEPMSGYYCKKIANWKAEGSLIALRDGRWNSEYCMTSIYVDSIQLSIKLKDTVCKLMRFHLNARNE